MNTRSEEIRAIFWRANHIRKIRVGYWTDNGVIVELGHVPIAGDDYTDEEATAARMLAAQMRSAE